SMVSLVIVSHSRALAEAVVALARQMAAPGVDIAIAAGIGAAHDEFGTDAVEISAAIQSVNSADGVAVLMDLGSAILSAEMALELIPAEIRAHVQLCPAPFVEGTLAGAVQASLGSSLEIVCSEAAHALVPKQEQLATSSDVPAQPNATTNPPNEPSPTQRHEVTVTLHNAHGLHARPAARFVQLAAGYDADIRVHKQGARTPPASARSLNRLATLGAVAGDQLVMQATGPQAAAALEALRALVESGFGEAEATENPWNPLPNEVQPGSGGLAKIVQASPISPGIGVGPLRRYEMHLPAPIEADAPLQDPQVEWRHLQQTLEWVKHDIAQRHNSLPAGAPQAGIFDAHRLILSDDALLERVQQLIQSDFLPAARAWHTAIIEVADTYRALPDVYMQQRAADVLDVGAQVLAQLTVNSADLQVTLSEPSVLAATEFTPTQVVQLDRTQVLALISSAGSANSHASILARALGIPAVAGAGQPIDELADGTLVGVDGSSGAIYISPSLSVVHELEQRRARWLEQQQLLREASHVLTYTQDGRRVEIAANLSGLADAQVAIDNGAEVVGVLRTEFLYLTRATAPSEEEQMAALKQIASSLQGRAIIVRTLDVGGDKQIPYLSMPVEANPYLGVRAIRLSLQQPEIFTTQICAILRAGADAELRILLPMITLREELTQAHELINAAHQALQAAGLIHRWPVQVGIMVETPAAALMAHALADQVDFFSIGTNDLTQYTLAAERGNPQLASYSDSLHPAVLRLIQQVVIAAHEHGKWAGVCGEIAADPLAAPVLVGLDVDELSMNVASIPQVKAVVRQLQMPAAHTLAQAALACATTRDVRDLVQRFSIRQAFAA
ncbi:MAG TPA: phosphoenolpyruvate--protein phosphotransferase, partial [Anaerolineae bacterium]